MNKVELIGGLGKDPERKNFDNGNSVTNFSMATNEDYQKNGEWVKQTEWHNITVWNKLGDKCAVLKKGDKVLVIGKLKTDKYEKSGVQHYSTKIVASEIYGPLPSLQGNSQGGAPEARSGSAGGQQTQQSHEPQSAPVDDLPF